jgi:structural maintenance of chromosome 4
MPSERKPRQQRTFVDPDAEEDDGEPFQKMRITSELLEELKRVDISNYPIPEKYGAAYKMDGKQRLVIDKMVLENFKSYFGKKIVGPLHPHFSAIVGANGSGKSNIIDALMFVFGSRVTKIRSTNVKALIHKSAGHNNLPFCNVTIYFSLCQDEENGQYSIVHGSKFTIRRTVTRNGTSKYFYNTDVVTRNDLRNRLQEHGIDMDHNRFLILQGEVEMISLMKPKAEKENDEGLLEYLDDIIGTSRLREKVKDLDMKVNAVDAERQIQLAKFNILF